MKSTKIIKINEKNISDYIQLRVNVERKSKCTVISGALKCGQDVDKKRVLLNSIRKNWH
jgi:hypothetical protein